MPITFQPAVNDGLVLCIDDDPAILECEKRFLEAFGYKVLTAPSGGKGLELASIHSVDVVIVDYCMPGMNGHEVAIEIKRVRPHAPIIMLSSSNDIPGKALKLVDAFVPKDRLSSQLLPVIAALHKGAPSPAPRSPIYD